jgi:bifunctional non-homologous end joining protein LigD
MWGITTRRAADKAAPARGKPRQKTTGSSPPAFIEPQLATLVDQAPGGDDWLHELKYDGYRILARVDAGTATLASRRANDWTAKFPTVRAAVEALPVRNAILDGEVAVPAADGRTSFQALQNALGAGAGTALYFVFDLLWLDGEDLTGLPLEDRKQRLAKLLAAAKARGGPLRYSDHVVGQGRAFFQQAQARGLEGIVSKRRGDPYRRGRSTGWLKTKAITRQEFVHRRFHRPRGLALGHRGAAGRHLRRRGQAGVRRQGGHRVQPEDLAELHRKLVPLEQKDAPFAVTPPPGWIGTAGPLGAARAGGGGGVHRMDRRRSPAPPLVPGFTRGQETPECGAGAGGPDRRRRPRPMPQPRRASEHAQPQAARPQPGRHSGRRPWCWASHQQPDRVVYPAVPLTKLEVAEYYEAGGPRRCCRT